MNMDAATDLRSYPAKIKSLTRCSIGVTLAVIVAVVLVGYGLWSWREYTRPGAVHFRQGAELAVSGNFTAAEAQWRQGAKEDPNYPGCFERLGDLYIQVRQYQDAVKNYTAAIKLRPSDGTLYKRVTAAYTAELDNKSALVTAKRAYELLPDDAEAAGTYGDLAQTMNDRVTAIKALRRAHELDPKNGRYLLTLANVEMDVQQMDVAEQQIKEYLNTHPDDIWASYLMAVVYNQKPRTAENIATAITYAEKAVNSRKAPMQVYPLLVQLYLDADHPKEALQVSQIAAKRSPNDTTILAKMVTCYMKLHQPSAAAEVSKRLKDVTDREQRISHLQEVMRFNNANVPAGVELAGLVEKNGDLKLARTYYVTLLRNAPKNAQARTAFHDFLLRIGRPDLAKLLLDPNFVP